jgi:hypothetical protein
MTKQGLYEFVIVYRPHDELARVVAGPTLIFADAPGDACQGARRYIPESHREKVADLEIIVRPF